MIPVHMLHISLTGAFWQEIDQALARGNGAVKQDTIRTDESESKPHRGG
jgi:hypothetical protein